MAKQSRTSAAWSSSRDGEGSPGGVCSDETEAEAQTRLGTSTAGFVLVKGTVAEGLPRGKVRRGELGKVRQDLTEVKAATKGARARQ